MTGLPAADIATLALLAFAILDPRGGGLVAGLWRRSRGWACPVARGLAPPVGFRLASVVVVLLLVASLAMTVIAGRALTHPIEMAIAVLLGLALALLSLIDLRQFRLPDRLTLTLLVAGLLQGPEPLAALLAAIACGLAPCLLSQIVARITGREGMGAGDAKLMAAMGAWLDIPATAFAVAAAALAGIACTLVLARIRERPARLLRLPFGPFLCAAFWLAWITFR